ncbi:MAG: hypothetical protein AAGI49_01280 [Bacteroidota bacterium]
MENRISFANVSFKQLNAIVPIKQVIDERKFEDWFKFSYELSAAEVDFLTALIKKNKSYINSYSEEELKIKLIGPLLNKVNFFKGAFRDWYERTISAEINDTIFSGKVDYMVAKGFKEPELPYFFIQEFKPSFSNSLPDDQLLAELMVAIAQNRTKEAKGAYIQGRYWNFAILEKDESNSYLYSLSQSFDAIQLEELKAIYINLQAVKHSLPDT